MLQEIVLSGARKFGFPAIFSIQQFHLPPCPIHLHQLESSESTAEVPPLDFQYVESTFNKTSLDDSSGVESSRRLFRPHSISLVYFTRSLSPLEFRWLQSIPTIYDSTLCGYIEQPSSFIHQNMDKWWEFGNNFICAKNIPWNVYMQIGCQQGRTHCSYLIS